MIEVRPEGGISETKLGYKKLYAMAARAIELEQSTNETPRL